MNFITLKELKKMVPVASEFKRVPGLKKILEDGIEVILRKQMENHAEVVVYKNGYVSYHAHERYTVFALHNCTHYYYESQGNEHQTIPHNHFEDMEWHIRLVLEGEDRLVRNLEARESETFSYAADVNPEYNNEMEDPRINVMDFVLNKEFLRKASELLKKHQWEMICRHYIEGMTHREIAAEMGVSHQYVTKGIKKGLHRIRCTTFQKMGHELLSRDELAVLDGSKCILQLRGVRPFLSDKYDLTQHPNYKLTSDYDPKNTFDIEKYLNRKEKIQPGDEFLVLDADSLPSA